MRSAFLSWLYTTASRESDGWRAADGRCLIPCLKRGRTEPYLALSEPSFCAPMRLVCSESADPAGGGPLPHTRAVAGSNPAAPIKAGPRHTCLRAAVRDSRGSVGVPFPFAALSLLAQSSTVAAIALWPKESRRPDCGNQGKQASPRSWAGRPVLVLRGRTGLDRRPARSRLKAGAAGVSVDGVRGLSSAWPAP
jgi:hypothetical protein